MFSGRSHHIEQSSLRRGSESFMLCIEIDSVEGGLERKFDAYR